MSIWSDKEARDLIDRVGALIIFGVTRTDAVYSCLSESLDNAYNKGVEDTLKKELKP